MRWDSAGLPNPAASQNRRLNHSPTDALIDTVVGGRLLSQIPIRLDLPLVIHLSITTVVPQRWPVCWAHSLPMAGLERANHKRLLPITACWSQSTKICPVFTRRTPVDPKRVHMTGSFPVGQLNSRQKSFVAFGNGPGADIGE